MPTIVTDDFNRADNAALGANWTTISGTVALRILTNQCSSVPTGGVQTGVFTGAGWTGGQDHWSQVTVITKNSTSDGGPACRMSTSAQTFFLCDINTADTAALGASMTIDVFRVLAGVFTSIAQATLVINSGDILRCEAEGTTIRGFVNGVQKVSGTNADAMTGKPGIEWWDQVAICDDFAAGDFAAAAAPIPPRQLPYRFPKAILSRR